MSILNRAIVITTACPQEENGREKTQMGYTEQIVVDHRQWAVP